MDGIRDTGLPCGPIGATPEMDDGVLLEIMVGGEGMASMEIISIRHGAPLRMIVEFAAGKGGFGHKTALLFVEGENHPLDPDGIVDENYPRHRRHHVHRIREINVVVGYGGAIVERRYPPSTTVETVLAWAVKNFPQIDPAMAGEFELALAGGAEEIPGTMHLGSFVKHPCHRIEFALIRGVIPNGGSHDP